MFIIQLFVYLFFRKDINTLQRDYANLQNRVSWHDRDISINEGNINRNSWEIDKLERQLTGEHEFANELSETLNKVGKDVIENESNAKTLGYINLSLVIICSLLLAVIFGLLFAKRDLLKKL